MVIPMKDETIMYHSINGVAHITLNRPDQINAFNLEMRDALFQTLELFRDDRESKVAIISGAGERGFCAGADLTEFGTAPSQVIARAVRWERDLWGLFLTIQKPLIAKLHGYVIGSGIEIAALCDIRIAADNSIFRMPEVALGMIPAAGGTQTLRNLVGLDRAMEMIMTNRVVKAKEAIKVCLVDRVVSEETLDSSAEVIAGGLAKIEPELLASIKSSVMRGLDFGLERGIQHEKRNSYHTAKKH
ncbi:MAG TPA: enoyl-CoA hydratase/isomerase family protein [SAR202 cluster bacterium]|jgi:enoyl-CoA hydratase/carnithine racemase|nr:enoyl-CoA hydratase/isomerase family protein [SAR202 cluster bacterium]